MGGPSEDMIEALHHVATKLQSQETAESICELTVTEAVSVLEFTQSSVLIREGEWLVPYATSYDVPGDGSRRMHLDQGLAGKTYQSRQSHLVETIGPDDETDPARPEYQSGISVPIGEHGVFQAVSTTEAAFDADDVKLAELLVSHTRTALNRITREQELQQQVERLDQFASVISHDLRNPLYVAQAHLELAREKQDTESLQKVADAHKRMDQLIDNILTFARAGTGAIDPETVELAQLTESCWADLNRSNATLHVETEQKIRADRERLRQLIENLLSNAVKYGETGVSVTVEESDNGFYIADDGPGIPPDERTAVFEAGYSPGTSGTGFGLSIAKQIAEAHEWEIRATEASSGGARFEITEIEVIGK